MQKETYLKELARYIVLNPVRARMVDRPQDWPWSSYSVTTGDAACPDWLRRDWLLSAFGLTEAVAVAHDQRFVAEGIGQPGPWEQLKQQVFLGPDAFVEELSRRVPTDRDLSEVPLAQRRPPTKPLAESRKQGQTTFSC